MDVETRNLQIAFQLAAPEDVIHAAERRDFFVPVTSDRYTEATGMSEAYYIMTFRQLQTGYSIDDIRMMYEEFKSGCQDNADIPESLFQLAVSYGLRVLEHCGEVPVVKREHLMDFREISLLIGQDMLTTAYLACKTFRHELPPQVKFDWNKVIDTNDRRLKHILEQGIAENHFHLAGSAPVFFLSWVAVMNHPQLIDKFFGSLYSSADPFVENRQIILSFSNDARPLSWNQSLRYAAWIRTALFQKVYGIQDAKELKLSHLDPDLSDITELSTRVMTLRTLYGQLFPQPDGTSRCLDYAIRNNNDYFDLRSANRLFCGERELLYRCFLACFEGRLNREEQNQFYAYLLLKNRFRAELIQVNQERGFANFFIYQDRKAIFWGDKDEYWREAQRMTVNAQFVNRTAKSLEIRFTPALSQEFIYKSILEEDNNILFADDGGCFPFIPSGTAQPTASFLPGCTAWTGWDDGQKAAVGRSLPFFYVLHFIKEQMEKPTEPFLSDTIAPRNSEVRRKARQAALALTEALERSEYLCSRIRGVDASSFEIACRPETFAAEFRFLKSFVPQRYSIHLLTSKKRLLPKLSVSYHVGEDFLDMADGLRAIDEAVRFLHLSRGDRLGHALALGVPPSVHYRLKAQTIILPKQDMLDNFVWLLFRSTEYGVPIEPNLRDEMTRQSEVLLHEIYGNCLRRHGIVMTLQEYYQAWQLRGDHPHCYRSTEPDGQKAGFSFPSDYSIEAKYNACCTDSYPPLAVFRSHHRLVVLMYYYHYGFHERQEGLKPCRWPVSDAYQQLMAQMQQCMQKMIAQKGIAIECNLSSNQLIGTFGDYPLHPLFRFNQHLLSSDEKKQHLCVSVNTDDQGVFDTSLENEYALLAESLSRMKDDSGERLYSDEVIYEYIDYIRRMGLEQIFPV